MRCVKGSPRNVASRLLSFHHDCFPHGVGPTNMTCAALFFSEVWEKVT